MGLQRHSDFFVLLKKEEAEIEEVLQCLGNEVTSEKRLQDSATPHWLTQMAICGCKMSVLLVTAPWLQPPVSNVDGLQAQPSSEAGIPVPFYPHFALGSHPDGHHLHIEVLCVTVFCISQARTMGEFKEGENSQI